MRAILLSVIVAFPMAAGAEPAADLAAQFASTLTNPGERAGATRAPKLAEVRRAQPAAVDAGRSHDAPWLASSASVVATPTHEAGFSKVEAAGRVPAGAPAASRGTRALSFHPSRRELDPKPH
jgi:hypothetical protein